MEYKYPAEEEFIKGLELNEGYYNPQHRFSG